MLGKKEKEGRYSLPVIMSKAEPQSGFGLISGGNDHMPSHHAVGSGSSDAIPDDGKKSWALYIKDRDRAENVGDPLLGVVHADNRYDAENMATYLSSKDNGGIVAVNTKLNIVEVNKESAFAWPSKTRQENDTEKKKDGTVFRRHEEE
jgi:hypothetical protein